MEALMQTLSYYGGVIICLAMAIYLFIFADRERIYAAGDIAIKLLAGIGLFFLGLSLGWLPVRFGM